MLTLILNLQAVPHSEKRFILYDSPLLVPLAKKSYTRVLELKLRQYEFM
jgi:hypothetical protein